MRDRFFEDDDFAGGVESDDRVVIFYSGHGATREQRGRKPESGYFCPYDAESAKDRFDWTSMFQMDWFVQLVAQGIKARQLLFMFDCCFSGIAAKSPEYESQREHKCKTDMIHAAKNKRSVQIFTSASKDEEVLASSGVNPPISAFVEGVDVTIKNLNPLDFPEGFASAHKLSKGITTKVRKTSILLHHTQNPIYYFSELDEAGEFVLKQFTEAEISNAREHKRTKFEPIELLISQHDLSHVFSKTNLVKLNRAVEDSHGLNYTYQQLHQLIHKLICQQDWIAEAIEHINFNGTGFSKQDMLDYLGNSLVGLGLSSGVFKPEFIRPLSEDSGDGAI